MKIFLHRIKLIFLVIFLPSISLAQTPVPLGAAASFVIYSIPGPVGNTGTSRVTGDVGTNVGSSTGFGNINGSFHDGDPASIAAMAPVNAGYISMGTQSTTVAMSVTIGSGETFVPGVYEALAATTLSGDLYLDGLNNPNSCFVIKINGAFNTLTGARIHLLNGAQSCNVFWRIGGAFNTMPGSMVVGNYFCDGAIGLTTGSKIDGRLYSISGAIQIASTVATAPKGCGAPVLTGPTQPSLGDAECFSLLTGVGQLTNLGISHIGGHVGTQNGPVTNFNPNFVDSIHYVPDAMTAAGTASIISLHTTLLALPCDITLTSPTNFGNSLVLTPHVYCYTTAVQMQDTVFLDAEGNADAVFVIKINGAFTTATFSNVVLRGGAKASNVFWVVEGLVSVLANSNFKGVIVSKDGAITLTDINLEGRAYSTAGAIIVQDFELILASIPSSITATGLTSFCEGDSVILTASASNSYLWSNGETTQSITVDSSGIYSVITNSICSKIDTSNEITVTVNPIVNTNLNLSICNGDSILIAGVYRKIPGIYPEILTSQFGCDSIINNNLIVNPIFNNNLNASICNGDSILIAGIYRKTPGLYSETLPSQFGCDSVINTNLIVNPIFNTNTNLSICDGDSILIAGIFRKTPGIYTENLSSQFGCDSIINTNLIVNPIFNTNLTASICNGDSILIAGIYRKDAGIYSQTLSSQFGCDSIINTNLSLNPVFVTNLNASICNGDSLLLYGLFRKTAGLYSDTLISQFGCDSIMNTDLIINALPTANAGLDTAITLGETIEIGDISENNMEYTWTPINGLSASNISNPVASPAISTTYILEVVNLTTGCRSIDSILITVNPVVDLEFFNGFSPNGDGLNDYWRIPVLSLYTTNKVQILNRWGNEVWLIENYNNIDRKFIGENMNSEPLPDGTYYYIINYAGVELNGWVFIKR